MRYVKYIGLAHIRQITAHDWRGVGINGDPVVWSAYNGFAVPLDSFTEDQIRKAIDPDPSFVITGEDGSDEEFIPQPQLTDMTPSQLDQTTETPLDVVAFANGEQDISRDDLGASTVTPAPGGAAPTGTTTGGTSGGERAGDTVH